VRQFASAGFRIWNLSREAKLVYSFFGLFSLLAIGSSALFYEDLVGSHTAGVRAYYAGEESAPAPRSDKTAAPGASQPGLQPGPEIALPDEAAGEPARPLTVAVTYRKLLEVTHFHLFTVPVFLLIIAHLFMLTGLRSSTKAAWILATWLAALVHLAAPWIVHYGGGRYAAVYGLSGAVFGVTCVALTAYPIWAMWFGAPPREERPARPAN
jgi:hypothetical protein